MPNAAVIEYRRVFRFDVAPDAVWCTMERTTEFEQWWAWLGDFSLHGPGLETGAVLVGVISPPLPYHMHIRVELARCVRPSSIDAVVHGDLEGKGQLQLSPDGGGTTVSAAWTLEMMQRPMRTAARFAYPMLRWGHDRVVDATVYGFRHQLTTT